MIVGIDFDGTIADTNTAKSRWITRELGMEVAPYLCDHTCCARIIGDAAYRQMGAQVYSAEVTLALPSVPGALKAILGLRERHVLIVVTARIGAMLGSAMTWLAKHPETSGLRLIGVSTSDTPKAKACLEEGVTVLVDDDERHLYPAVALGMQTILFKQSAPDSLGGKGLQVCRSWGEIYLALANTE